MQDPGENRSFLREQILNDQKPTKRLIVELQGGIDMHTQYR